MNATRQMLNNFKHSTLMFRQARSGLGSLVVALVLLVGFSGAAEALTATASPATCATVNAIGTVAWGNPTRAVSSNNSYAAASVNSTTTQILQCTGYGFAIPANATITGITVNVQRNVNRIDRGDVTDAAMRLVKAGTMGATDLSSGVVYTTTNTYDAHGGATSLWGDTWAAADINNVNFGAAFAATKGAGGNVTVNVDHIQIAVDYTVPPPTVTAISPNTGSTAGGTAVTITGTNLTGATSVTIGGIAATGITVVNATTITATTPAGTAGAQNVVVTTPGGTGTGVGLFTYVVPPTVTAISPNAGTTAGGTAVTITGTGFTGATSVTIGGTAATSVVVVSDTSITAVTPAGTAGAKNVVVTSPSGTGTGTGLFTYASPPTVTTNAASSVLTTSAVLNGTVNDNGNATTVTFEYGLTSGSYTKTVTASQSPLAAGAGSTAVTATAMGLACNKTYYFRVKGVNTVGTANGTELSFATSCTAPTATTNAATSVTTTKATLNGTINDKGASTTVTFEYSTDTSYSSSITASQSPVGPDWGDTAIWAVVSGLPCNTTYNYRVKGVNSIGSTTATALTFTTLACPTGVSVTRNPSSCVNVADIGTRAWTTLNATASDNVYATTSLGDNQQSNYLKCTGYGFAIPSGVTITGITVNVERNASATNSPIRDLAMRAVKNDVIGTTDRSTATTYPTSDAVEAHGGAADLWGTTWTVADINSATFGAALAAYKNGTNGGTFTANVDHMPITVTYTPPSTAFVASISRASTNPTAANTSVSWDVVFSGNATGVDATDFQLVQGGLATGASITGVSPGGSGRVWKVTANTGTGTTGTLGLNLVDDDTIKIGGTSLGGNGLNNGDFIGEEYTLAVPTCNGTMIFCDDFERSNPGGVGNGWIVTPAAGSTATCSAVYTGNNTGCAGIDTDIPPFNATNNRANPTSSMFMRWTQLWVDSRTIDLSSYPSALFSFWLRRGGDAFSEYPEAAGENYLVQYLDNTGAWKILAQYPSGVMQGEVFAPVIQLPSDAMHANFKVRFFQPSGSGNAGGGATGGAPGVVGYDYWHVDNVIVSPAPESSYVGAFCDNFEGGLARWSFSAEGGPANLGLVGGAAIGDGSLGTTDFNSSTHELDMRWGYVVASTLRTDMTGVSGNIKYWVKNGTTANRAPDAGEDLLVEYYSSAGSWKNLATYTSTDASAGTVFTYDSPMPADAKHTKFRLRFRMLSGSGYDLDYWHVDDVCVGTQQPNVDLSVTKVRTGPLVPGSQVDYTITVKSNGPDNVSNGTFQVTDSLPTYLTFVSANTSADGTGWNCTSNAPLVTCNYVGALASGATLPPITLKVAVDALATGSITNTATVSGTVTDSNLVNNSGSDTATLTPGFVFTDSACVNGKAFTDPAQTCKQINWSPQIAGQNLTGIYITSVNTSTIPTQLSGSVTTVINMEVGLSCIDPKVDAGVQATFSAATSASNSTGALPLCEPNGATPTSWSTAVGLSFAAGNPSVGPYIFNYADVGQVNLYARNSVATTQIGSSGAFVVKPGGFVLSAIERNSDSFANPAAAGPAGAAFVRAGEKFNVTVTATTCTPASATCVVVGATTPNYGNEVTPEGVKLTPANVTTGMVTPVPAVGGAFGAFSAGVAKADGVTYLKDGVTRSTPFTWSEVGIITLSPSVADGDYLASGDATGTTSGNVGRFYPDHFNTVITKVANVPMNCPTNLPTGLICPTAYPGSVYSGQTFTLTTSAMNSNDVTTVNYNTTTGFAKTVTLTPLGVLGTDTSPTGAGSLGVTSQSAFANGTISTNAETYSFSSTTTAPTNIYIRAYDADASSKRLTSPTTSSVEAGVMVLSGRIKVSNAYGTEQLPLTLTATAQYYTSTGWLNSTVDSITQLVLTSTYNVLKPGTATVTGTTAVTLTPSSSVLSNGVLTIKLGVPSGGAGVAPIDPGVPSYMQKIYGTASFGVYQGGSNYIYRRER